MTSRVSALEDALLQSKGNYDEALDTIWMLLASLLVFFMHSGFSMLEAGCVRAKNAQNILAKNLVVVTGGFLCWYFVGYGFALGHQRIQTGSLELPTSPWMAFGRKRVFSVSGSSRVHSVPQEAPLSVVQWRSEHSYLLLLL